MSALSIRPFAGSVASSRTVSPNRLEGASVTALWGGGGGQYAHGADVSGRYSEKASYGGQMGIGSPRFATVATGGPMAVSVTGLHGKNPTPTTVMALDAGEILKRTGGNWPGEPAQMAAFLKANPDCVLKSIKANPPQSVRIDGIPKGTQVTILTGAEAMEGKRPPGSQAMVTNLGQLPEAMQAALGGPVSKRPPPSGGNRAGRDADTFVPAKSPSPAKAAARLSARSRRREGRKL